MTTMHIAGTLLTASAEDRVLTYRLLPFGEPGRTNIGKVTAGPGSLTIPEDVTSLVANLEHDGTRPAAKFLSVQEDEQGLTASVRVLTTTAGNDLLTEATEGVRKGISVEIDNPVVRAGRLVAGLLSGAGFVTKPAFLNATLMAAEAPDTGDIDADETSDADTITVDGVTYRRVADPTPTDTAADPADAPAQGTQDAEQTPADTKGTTVTDTLTASAAQAPAGLHATTTKAPAKGATDVFRMLASEYASGGERRMLAALADIVPGDILGLEQPQFVGELWSGRAYQRKIVPLFNHANLTSFEVKGWRWVTKPAVAPYAGNKTAVPTNEVSTAPVSIDVERIAGAHDIDRKFKDFGDAQFFAAYYKAMTESYAQVSDAQVLADVLAAATATTAGTVPTGVSPAMAGIVDGALAVLANANALPSFAVVAPDLYRDILLTRNDDALSLLNASLGLEDGTVASFRVVPNGGLPAGTTLVGSRDALTVHELGEVPIRVEAENIANGGVDAGVFGYYAVNVHDAGALALVDTAPGA